MALMMGEAVTRLVSLRRRRVDSKAGRQPAAARLTASPAQSHEESVLGDAGLCLVFVALEEVVRGFEDEIARQVPAESQSGDLLVIVG